MKNQTTVSTHKTKENVSPFSYKQDCKTAVVLLFLAALLIIHTLSFPMSGSFAGVENQWYISPALFPFVVCGLLTMCSVILLYKAVLHNGTQQFFNLKGWIGNWQSDQIKDRWYVIWNLLSYVYVFIPSIDFYLASVFFLFSLTSRFYHATRHSLVFTPIIQTLLAAVLIGIKLNVDPSEEINVLSINQHDTAIFYSDMAGSIALVCVFVLNWLLPEKQNRSKAITHTILTLVAPLLLVLIFTFLLYVPMPVEYGTVSQFLSYLVYDVLGIT